MTHTIEELQMRQALPLNLKVAMTKTRIREWVNEYGESGVYVSFSGGKDSTVLLDIVRQNYPNIPAVFIDTGLEYPEIREFVKTFDNVVWLKPKLTFKQVIEKYGYPFISKEVSECVYGARKYLTSILQEASLDRQTDRQTDRQYGYFYDKLCGQGKYAKPIEGGADSKYRKLRGLGEFTKQKTGKQRGRKQSETGNNARDVHEGQTDKGECP